MTPQLLGIFGLAIAAVPAFIITWVAIFGDFPPHRHRSNR